MDSGADGRENETICADVVRYGLASKPICGMSKMPPGRLCRHHAQAGAVPAATSVLIGGRLYGMASDTFISIVQLAEKI